MLSLARRRWLRNRTPFEAGDGYSTRDEYVSKC
eukprot:SAG11_NODE_26062_length_350_cov_1.011952_1_plen_32_part_10